MICSKCNEDVEMVDDSYVDDATNNYQIHLECPECKWQFFTEVFLGDLYPIQPVADSFDQNRVQLPVATHGLPTYPHESPCGCESCRKVHKVRKAARR